MSKQSVIVSLLSNVVDAARVYASAGTGLTRAAMLALQGGAHVEDVIEAARGGFEEVGEVIPRAFPSNLRRVAKADPKFLQAILDSDRSLNNELLSDLAVPTQGAKGGRPSKAESVDKATATPSAPAANDAQANPRETAIAALQNIMAIRTKLGVPMGSQFNELEDHLSAMLAILRSIKVAQTPGPDAVKA